MNRTLEILSKGELVSLIDMTEDRVVNRDAQIVTLTERLAETERGLAAFRALLISLAELDKCTEGLEDCSSYWEGVSRDRAAVEPWMQEGGG